MANIVIPEAALDEFLKLVLARVTKEGNDLVAESRARRNADEAMFRARFEVMLERGQREINEMRAAEKEKIERRLRETEEKIRVITEEKIRVIEEEIQRKRAAIDEEIQHKRHSADEEIKCKRRAAEAIEAGPVSAPPYRAASDGETDGPGSLTGSVDQDDLGVGVKGQI